jgi:hypothetical protein
MASDRIDCEILKRAAEIAGGEDELAKRLNVESEDMHEWVQGKATAPAGIYIMALGVLAHSAAAGSTKWRPTFDSKFTAASHGFTARKANKKSHGRE